LYTHVANKEELLELVVDAAFGELQLPEHFVAENWRADLLMISRSLRETMMRHAWMPAVLSTAGLIYLGPNVMRMSEAMLGILETAGFDGAIADRAAGVIFSYLLGATTTETAMLTTVARAGMGEQEWMEQIMDASVKMAEPYPRLHKRYLAHRNIDSAQSREDYFDEEMNVIMDGLAARRGR
ncbi:TetR/AcrR family transcriptional regulator C-terminal domain-containing protein, partial [Nocardia crassostreae]|uniref:TetR/AcrR family transcriptional regulator C-terminal domain-containing protein n=1 Tax=Nocardia crassostreae TaxID=53428 RepID=UPI000835F653